MSNQKPPPTVVQQTRYPTQSTFLQRPPTPRADAAFHVSQPQQPYVAPPPNQTGNQGPALRGMAPTGPPNQASTPPNNELKVSQMSQSVNLAFVPQQVRGATQGFFGRPPPQTQPPRMPNHRLQLNDL
ncbi:hypothetical protein QE152_g8731 [Popillia japonica]|uniref:Uncharacterized protein n=1 Tax=Popillia japonica TaxID=7064 RepID=A0AAW1M3D0_POPJA